MAKETGIGMTLTVDDSGGTGRDISSDVTNVSVGVPRNLQDISGIDVASMERLALLGDGVIDFGGIFNPAANLSHDVLKNIGTNTTTRTAAVAISGQTLTLEVHFTDYAINRAADGSLVFSAPGQLAATTAYGWS